MFFVLFILYAACLVVVQLLLPEGESAGGVVNKCIMLFACLFVCF